MTLKESQPYQIKQLLGIIVKRLGFNPENVKPEDLEFIANHLKEDFTVNELTIEQVDYAFKLALQGMLPDVKLESNKRLSPLFISNVLLPYKRSSYFQKSKETKRLELNKKVEWSYSMKKNHYEWLLNSVFLEESERNGVRGEFPDIVVASWKDIYDYMLIEEMIEALKGEYLKERLREIQSKENIMIRDSRRKVSYDNIIKTNKGNLPSAFYRHEVIDWFNKYRDQLMF